MSKKIKSTFGIAMLAALLCAAAVPTHADESEVDVFANPDTIAVGDITPVGATGLDGLDTAQFGLDDTSGGSLSADGSTYGPSAQAPVNDGSSTVFFKATQPGTYIVDVTDGESPLGQTTVTVTGGEAPNVGAQLSVSPPSISAGRTATITATGLGGLETADFGLGAGPSGASLDPESASVSDGTASTTFTATEPGTYTVDVSDGETSLATVEVTVTAAPIVPTPTPTSPPVPVPNQGGVVGWIVLLIAIITLLLLAATVTAVVITRRRAKARNDLTQNANRSVT